MTCISALEHDGKVFMGCDSASVGGLDVEIIEKPKVFINGKFIIGYTSSFRMGQLLQYELHVRDRHTDEDVYQFLVKEFIAAVRKCLKSGGYSKIDNNTESGGTFLVGFMGKVYWVDNDFQITTRLDGITACGCGGDYARGALAACTLKDPKAKVLKSLEVAHKFSGGVRPPFHVLSL